MKHFKVFQSVASAVKGVCLLQQAYVADKLLYNSAEYPEERTTINANWDVLFRIA